MLKIHIQFLFFYHFHDGIKTEFFKCANLFFVTLTPRAYLSLWSRVKTHLEIATTFVLLQQCACVR
jgi:hypothetical protein